MERAMPIRFLLSLSLGLGLVGAVRADVPNVATDIAPVHSLVARVMLGVGEPALIVPPLASPHGHAMRPSEAAALEGADLVIWMGEALTPWLEGAIETLASDAQVIELLGAGRSRVLPFREGVAFAAHDHGEDKHEAQGQAGQSDEDHAAHADDAAHDHDHVHEGADPHAWLDPMNARIWLDVIAKELAEHDPDNAAVYAANATAAQAELDALASEIAAQVAPVRGKPFLVLHDAYQYFEWAFDLSATGALALSDASDPGPARIAQLRDLVREENIVCVFSESQFDPKLALTVFGDMAGHGVLDPIGSDLAPGPDLYPQLLRNIAIALTGCLAAR